VKAVGYFREGTIGGHSFADQNRAFLEFCEREGYEVAATFLDRGGDADGRPGFRQLLEYLRRPEKGFVVVIVPSITTLGTDLREAARSFFQIDSLGAQVLFLDNGEDGMDRLLAAWNNRSGQERLSERVTTAMRRRAVRGEVLGRPAYGYRVGPRRRLEVVPEEAAVVRYIYRLYLQEGLGLRLIARRLNEEGVLTRRNKPWSMVGIRDLLRNRVYLGTYSRFGVRVPGSHPPLVSPDDFRRVQEKLSARRTSFSPRQNNPFLLSGLVYCGQCGNKMIGVSRRQRWKRSDGSEGAAEYRYYQCESRTNQSVCQYHTQRAEVLEERVRETLAQLPSANVPTAGDPAAVIAGTSTEMQRLRTRLRQLDKRLEQALDAAAQGKVPRDRLRAYTREIAEEQIAVEEALLELERRAEEQSEANARRERRERVLNELLDGWTVIPLEERQSLLREIIDRIVITAEGPQVHLRP
jgi:site-specific DNA recombinase